MELSNILGKLGHKEVEPEKFLAIELTDDIIQAAVWHVSDDATEVVAIGTGTPWNGDTGDLSELVTAVDSTITKATEGLKETPTKVIFGIPTIWLDGESVKPEKKAYIKQICTELELTPLGFVVVMDSLIRYLKMQEGTPTTAILIQVADTELTIAAVMLGKTNGIVTLPRTDDVAIDVETGIAQCIKGISQLPSRFIVFDGMHDLEDVIQNLTLVEWLAKFPFLHIPKIEALNKDVVIRSLCVAGGTEVAKSIGFTIKDPVEKPPEISPYRSEIDTTEEDDLTSAEDLDEQPSVVQPAAEDLTALGFSTSDEEEVEVEEPTRPKLTLPSFKLPTFTIPSLNLPKLKLPLWVILTSVVVALGFFLLAGSLWLFPKATVSIYVAPKQETAQFAAKLSELASEKVDTSVTGESSVATTGVKQVGDPATGEVTIYNRTVVKKTFPKGTLLTAGSLKFTLEEDTTVASKSAGSDYVDVPGKATSKVTASAIGEASNLGSSTEFVIGTFSKDSFVAKNDAALKGGSSKSVSSVSSKDKTTLVAELKSKLEQEARGKLQMSGGLVYIIPSDTKLTDEKYSAKVGDEESSLTATLTVTVSGYSLNEQDLKVRAKSILQDKLQGYELIGDPGVELGNGTAEEVNIQASTQALPIIDQATIASSLRGVKDRAIIDQIVGSTPGFSGVKVAITPSWLPPALKSLPRKAENITIQIVAAQ